MTKELFRDDAYLAQCETVVAAVGEQGIRLAATVFYAQGGGQPGDTGVLRLADGREISVTDTRRDETTRVIWHIPAAPAPAELVGQTVSAAIDWARRYRLMRTHTLLHLLCAVVPGGVTGGSVREGSGRIDFDLPDTQLDKQAIESALNRLIEEDHAVRTRWISDAELAAQPALVRTMSVKPPVGEGRVRLLEIEDVDLQPCGGTHIRHTGEIGPARVTKIENKGAHNRRVSVALHDA